MLSKKNKLPKKNITLSKFNNPNVGLIILESHIGAYTNYINKDFQPSITPFLDSLSTRSINFNNCYANGNRTIYGLSSILCSYPVIPGYPLSRYDQYLDKDMTDPLTFSSVLKEINEKLWSIEDDKRMCEKNSDFGDKFIKLSRDVHFLNDERAKIKLEINDKTGSKIKEIKQYTNY